jgi:hypothetical protein
MDRILEHDRSAPLINLLVVNQRTGEPSRGADYFLRKRFRLQDGPIGAKRRRRLIEKAASTVYAYPDWPSFYYKLFRSKPPASDPTGLIAGTEVDGMPPATASGRFGGQAESPDHKRLKQYVHDHPECVGAPKRPTQRKQELMLLSGDEVDVFFSKNNLAYLIELKSARSSEEDLLREVYQCIKYRAVFVAQRHGLTPGLSVHVTLVTETEPPKRIRDFANLHGIHQRVIAAKET